MFYNLNLENYMKIYVLQLKSRKLYENILYNLKLENFMKIYCAT